MEFSSHLNKLKKSKFWNSSILVGIAIAIMIYTRFYGLGEPYIKAFDPYLFWRVSEGIWETGSWEGTDNLRYYPYGWESPELAPAVPYTLVYLGKLAGNLKAAVKFYPAFFGLLSIISMALLGRKFGVSGISALFLSIIPAYMYRTSQGFADKEPLAFFLGLLGWYFIAEALDKKTWLPAVYSGISMGMISAVWGGKLLFAMSLAPLLVVLALKEETKKVAQISVSLIIYVLMHAFVPRYSLFYKDPISLGILGMSIFGLGLHSLYKIKFLEKFGKKRFLIAVGIGAVFAMIASLLIFGDALFIVNRFVSTYQSPFTTGKVTHSQTVAENQKTSWSWNLLGNSFWTQLGSFFFLALGVLIFPILQKAYELATKKGAEAPDYVYAGALVITIIYLIINFQPQTPILLFLLSLPKLIDTKKPVEGGWKTIMIISLVVFSIYSGFSSVRLFVFTSVGVALGAAYFAKMIIKNRYKLFETASFWGTILIALLWMSYSKYVIPLSTLNFLILTALCGGVIYISMKNRKFSSLITGTLLIIFTLWQIYPYSVSHAKSLGGASLTTTWFENAKWMQFNVPAGEPVVTWWDYGYWIQTLGNTTSLGDGGNVGPGGKLNWYTGHFFANDDVTNTTAWVEDWNLTYFTIDYAMLPKYWAYSTLGGMSNVLNQMSPAQNQEGGYVHATEFGLIEIYTGYSDDYGPVAIGEVMLETGPVYIVGNLINNQISRWFGFVDEFAHFASNMMVCEPIGYCKSQIFGNLERLNQSIIVYPRQIAILGDQVSMHSTFTRLWFFNGLNTDYRMLLNNGETKTFIYDPQ